MVAKSRVPPTVFFGSKDRHGRLHSGARRYEYSLPVWIKLLLGYNRFGDQWTIDGDQIVPEGYSHDKGKSNAQTSYGHSILGDTYFDTETFWKAHGECKPPEDVYHAIARNHDATHGFILGDDSMLHPNMGKPLLEPTTYTMPNNNLGMGLPSGIIGDKSHLYTPQPSDDEGIDPKDAAPNLKLPFDDNYIRKEIAAIKASHTPKRRAAQGDHPADKNGDGARRSRRVVVERNSREKKAAPASRRGTTDKTGALAKLPVNPSVLSTPKSRKRSDAFTTPTRKSSQAGPSTPSLTDCSTGSSGLSSPLTSSPWYIPRRKLSWTELSSSDSADNESEIEYLGEKFKQRIEPLRIAQPEVVWIDGHHAEIL
ncbi:hypothetical protein AcW1_008452 [Taiwanofungus camphoratus]|nr:hypothetical protein AcW1_008452 [Antrodia cinnamomea]